MEKRTSAIMAPHISGEFLHEMSLRDRQIGMEMLEAVADWEEPFTILDIIDAMTEEQALRVPALSHKDYRSQISSKAELRENVAEALETNSAHFIRNVFNQLSCNHPGWWVGPLEYVRHEDRLAVYQFRLSVPIPPP